MPGCSARFWFLMGVAMQGSHKLWNCCSQPNHVGVGTKSAVCLLTLLWHIVLFGCDRGQNSGLWMVISLVNYVWRMHLQPKWSRYAVLYSCSGTILDVTYCSGFRMWIWVQVTLLPGDWMWLVIWPWISCISKLAATPTFLRGAFYNAIVWSQIAMLLCI